LALARRSELHLTARRLIAISDNAARGHGRLVRQNALPTARNHVHPGSVPTQDRGRHTPPRGSALKGILCALWHLCSQARWRCASSIPHRRPRGVRRNTPIQTKALIPPHAVARARRASAVVIKNLSTRGISTRGTSSVPTSATASGYAIGCQDRVAERRDQHWRGPSRWHRSGPLRPRRGRAVVHAKGIQSEFARRAILTGQKKAPLSQHKGYRDTGKGGPKTKGCITQMTEEPAVRHSPALLVVAAMLQ
jgi:hypothetical protein